MTDVPGALNLRDVGGLSAGAGTTRSGVLFRSGNLARLGADGERALRALGLRRIVDLRDDAERAMEPTAPAFDDLTVRLPLFAGSAASFFAEDLTLADLYRSLVDDAGERMVEVVRAVLADQPVLVHCTVGKDRTGVTVALALAAAGVDEDAVIADYARTEALLPQARNERVLGYLRRAFPAARHLEELATLSPASAMEGMLADLRGRFGGAAEYLAASGLGDDELRALRRVLVA